jgi:hypothetical protein
VVPHFWNVHSLSRQDNHLGLHGWALPFAGESENTRILVNGKERGEIRFSETAEVARVYPWWPNARRAEFRVTVDERVQDILESDEIQFRAVPRNAWQRHHNPYAALHLS